MNRKSITHWIVVLALFGLAAGSFLAWYADRAVRSNASAYCTDEITELPAIPVGLVLGTIDSLSTGRPNWYFKNRMQKAAELYQAGKVRHFILSGDNHIKSYDEPEAMRLALIELGIPDSCLTLDYAGFRTFDSMIRCKEVFGKDSIIVISQEFHNLRAVYIGRQKGMIVFGANAEDAYNVHSPKREYLARANAWLDIHLFGTEPKFLGKKIKLPI